MVQKQNGQLPRHPGNSASPCGGWLHGVSFVLAGMVLAALASVPAQANTLCVSPGGSDGCFASITKAIAAAAPHDTIRILPGEYDEAVIIDKPLALVGKDRDTTIIDAKGKPNGIFIDGIDHAGLRGIVVRDLTVENANFEGILVANASWVTISSVKAIHNDKSLDASTVSCPGLPDFETAEGFDCGEGIHLTGVSHSIVSKSFAIHNAGGILLSDDTGRTHDNLIADNFVADNPFDCGITLASHPPASITQSSHPLGVDDNTISGNISKHNGRAIEGAGAGVGIFDSIPGTRNTGNVVIGNILTDNGLPGVALHSHAPGQHLDNNLIVGNFIARNGADTEDAATPGPTGINAFGVSPIHGLLIAQNTIVQEKFAVVTNTPDLVSVHLNNLLAKTGVDNLGIGEVSATENWWGCTGGPTDDECSGVEGAKVYFTPWLTQPFKNLLRPKDHEKDHEGDH